MSLRATSDACRRRRRRGRRCGRRGHDVLRHAARALRAGRRVARNTHAERSGGELQRRSSGFRRTTSSRSSMPKASRTGRREHLRSTSAIRAVAAGRRGGILPRHRDHAGPITTRVREFGSPMRELVEPLPGRRRGGRRARHRARRPRPQPAALDSPPRHARRRRAAAVIARLVSNATLAPVRRLTAAAERIAETGEPSERVPEGGKGELGAARRVVQHDARVPRGVARDAAPLRRRRVARAADAAHEPPDEHRRPPRRHRARPAAAPGAPRRPSPRVAGDALAHRRACSSSRARRRARPRAVPARRARRGHARARPLPLPVRHVGGVRRRGDRRRRRSRPDGARGLEPPRERRQVERRGRHGRGRRSRAASCRFATTGRGSTRRTRPLVFERFYRSAAARSMPGAGLGLSIVREVAESHGGTVVAENAAGGGARFRLSLNGAARPGSLRSRS